MNLSWNEAKTDLFMDALLRQCDALEAQLRQTRTFGAHLLDSTFHHHLAV